MSSSSGTLVAPCGLVNAPTDLVVSEGGRLLVTLTTDPAAAVLTVGDVLNTVLQEDGRTLKIKPAYGVVGPQEIPLHLECAGTSADVVLPVNIRALRWSSTPSWMPGRNGPLAREYGSIWMDSQDPNRLLVFGGFVYVPRQFTVSWDGWSLDVTTGEWTFLSMTNDPPHLAGGRMLNLPGRRTSFYYGGLTQESDTPYSLMNFDYAPDALSWAPVPADTSNTHGDYQPAFILDAPRQRFLTLCGVNTTVGYHCGINAFHGSETAPGGWLSVRPADGPAPTGRNGIFYVHDEETERFIMFSGDQGGTTAAGDMAQDLWAFELAEDRWVKLSDGDPSVIGRRNGAYMLDPVNHRMFIWGGTANGMTTTPGLFALDLDRGEEHWDRVTVDGEPPIRTSAMAVYDAARARMLVGFGNGDAIYADLWALEL